MKRKTRDILFSAGGLLLAGLLLATGLMLTSSANTAKTYVREQLGRQNITFPELDELTAEQRQAACLVRYAGEQLTTGEQAECYATNYIGLHLKSIADGASYADLAEPEAQLREQVTRAAQANDPALDDLREQLAELTAERQAVLKDETLRGLLLTTYGFSQFSAKAGQDAIVAYLAAGLLALLAIGGFVHALVTPQPTGVSVPGPARAPDDEQTRV